MVHVDVWYLKGRGLPDIQNLEVALHRWHGYIFRRYVSLDRSRVVPERLGTYRSQAFLTPPLNYPHQLQLQGWMVKFIPSVCCTWVKVWSTSRLSYNPRVDVLDEHRLPIQSVPIICTKCEHKGFHQLHSRQTVYTCNLANRALLVFCHSSIN